LIALSLLPLVACDQNGDLSELEFGDVNICLGGPEVVRGADDSFDIDVEGVVVSTSARDFDLTGCDEDGLPGLSIIDAQGDSWRLGFSVDDEDGSRIDLGRLSWIGREIHFTYRYRKPLGDVSGVVITDADGMVAAGEEGSWGGALRPEDKVGFSVTHGKEVIAELETHCGTLHGYTLEFSADTQATLSPVDSATLTIEGRDYRAHAVVAHKDQGSCAGFDYDGTFGWTITR